MITELRALTLGDLLDQPAETQDFAAASELLTGLYYDNHLAGLIGFIPQGEDAYLWMVKTPVALAHPISFARHAKRVIHCLRTKYKIVYGHSNPQSLRWLKFLGAYIEEISPTLVEFRIYGE